MSFVPAHYDFGPPTTAAKALSDQYWRGEGDSHNPLLKVTPTDIIEIVPNRVYFIITLANVVVLTTPSGVIVVDTGAKAYGTEIGKLIHKAFPGKPLIGIVYTHGHIDHVGGCEELIEEMKSPTVPIYGHCDVNKRFARYGMTAGYNAAINSRQFQMKREHLEMMFADTFVAVTHPYGADGVNSLSLTVDDLVLELRHDKGETDDATWVYLPQHSVLIPGDFVIWSCPNCGNPQKSQRYPIEWAAALRKMAALNCKITLPGHGPVVWTHAQGQDLLTNAALLLESVVGQTLTLMNNAAPLHEIVHAVVVPPALLELPYLRPVYDDPSFIVRNVYRLYGGWYSGFLPELRPARHRDVGAALAQLIMTSAIPESDRNDSVLTQMKLFFESKESKLTLLFSDYLISHIEAGEAPVISPGAVKYVYQVRLMALTSLANADRSLMGRGIYLAAAQQTKAKL